ncbi:hypothetical protein [Bacillus paralicheniformis]|uniref:hypothetical protein n=1 Tax=Bacillus paralicheniformis TaxID=1648923 RepID=UPI00119CDC96|nr:hypothetical protein [Bacillus paralicheniformis]
MIHEKLVELYFDKAPASSFSVVEIEEEIVWLLNKGFTIEQLHFFINYLARFYPQILNDHFASVVMDLEETLLIHYEIAKAKQAVRRAKEAVENYDPRNTIERKDTPQWFGKSFNKHLFK